MFNVSGGVKFIFIFAKSFTRGKKTTKPITKTNNAVCYKYNRLVYARASVCVCVCGFFF